MFNKMCVLRDSRLSTEEKMLNSGLYRGCQSSVGVIFGSTGLVYALDSVAQAKPAKTASAAASPRRAAPETNVASRLVVVCTKLRRRNASE